MPRLTALDASAMDLPLLELQSGNMRIGQGPTAKLITAGWDQLYGELLPHHHSLGSHHLCVQFDTQSLVERDWSLPVSRGGPTVSLLGPLASSTEPREGSSHTPAAWSCAGSVCLLCMRAAFISLLLPMPQCPSFMSRLLPRRS